MTLFQHLGDRQPGRHSEPRAIERDPVSEKKKAVWIVFLHRALLGIQSRSSEKVKGKGMHHSESFCWCSDEPCVLQSLGTQELSVNT